MVTLCPSRKTDPEYLSGELVRHSKKERDLSERKLAKMSKYLKRIKSGPIKSLFQ